MYTYQDWLRMEQVARKAINGAQLIATDERMQRDLEALKHVVAELRHASGQLGATPDELGVTNEAQHALMLQGDQGALERLRETVFKRVTPRPLGPDYVPSDRVTQRAEDGHRE